MWQIYKLKFCLWKSDSGGLYDFRAMTREKEETMQNYVCSVCGYVYDPEEGDPENGVEAGTPFSEVPEDWNCPVCGAEKEDFEPE